MEFSTQEWQIKDLIKVYKDKLLKLDPPYQRNFIWSKKDQNELIDSILIKGFPLPTFFLLALDDGSYEMVDGQQRTRTILAFYKSHYEINHQQSMFEEEKEQFENYNLAITIINNLRENESIEEFYARVNKTGRKINKPELNKAEYFYTEFLDLNTEMAGYDKFQALSLFTENSVNRMNDIDFVSELIALIVFGNYEKKDKVDELYESDISAEQKRELTSIFKSIIDKIYELNGVYPLRKTRYRQRNDFFTLFGFILFHAEIEIYDLAEFYKILVLIADEISPSNNFCPPLREYAINCVSQSNQKQARDKRLRFFEELLLNTSNEPNTTQFQILEFYGIQGANGIQRINGFLTLNISKLKQLKPNLSFNE